MVFIRVSVLQIEKTPLLMNRTTSDSSCQYGITVSSAGPRATACLKSPHLVDGTKSIMFATKNHLLQNFAVNLAQVPRAYDKAFTDCRLISSGGVS